MHTSPMPKVDRRSLSTRLPWLALVLLLSSACGGAGGVRAGTPGVDAPLGVLVQPRLTGGSYYYGTEGDWDLRVGGAFMQPVDHIGAVAIDGDGARGVHLYVVDVEPGSATRGEGIGSYRDVYTGSSRLRGVAATSFRAGPGRYDALYAVVDADPLGIYAFEVRGDDPSSAPSAVAAITGVDGILDPKVVPALESRRNGEGSDILMAYAATGPQGYQIRVGFLSKQGEGSGWHFTGTDWIAPAAVGNCGGGIYQDIAAAYDATRDEFGLGWFCNNTSGLFLWSTNMIRVSGTGLALSSVPFVTHIGVDAEHTGSTLSYNQRSDRYLHTFQHNAASVTPTGASGLDCTRPVDSCQDTVMGCIDRGSMYAAGVDYRSGFDFRMAGQCVGSIDCGGDVISGSLAEGAVGFTCGSHWLREPASLAPARTTGLNMAHAYVRCPDVGTAVLLHLWVRPGSLLADLRASLIDDDGTFAFDE